MSNSNHEQVGYQKPPRQHRFSSDNQPKRRRKVKVSDPDTEIVAGLLGVLTEQVTYERNGKKQKSTVAAVLDKRLVKGVMAGSVSEQIRFMKMMFDAGIFDVLQYKEKLEREHAEQREADLRHSKDLELAKKTAEFLTDTYTLELVLSGAEALVHASSQCSCGALDNYREQVEFAEQVVEQEQKLEQFLSEANEFQGSAPGFVLGQQDDLSAGKIGTD